MLHETSNSTDAWLLRNLNANDTSLQQTSGIKALNPIHNYYVRVLRLMLALSAMAVVATWYLEESQELMSSVDRVGYSVLFAVTSLGSWLLALRPGSIQTVASTVFITFITYLLAKYYHILFYQNLDLERSSYALTTLLMWLPLGYVAGYIFFSPLVAVRTSLAIYAAIALPQLLFPP
ncbi:MAG: hypothetical protein GWN00_35480, partial [Aliifodinibius sp.]|nr:hypothetical protein [Phycisphaerae bacterium]NIT61320.1 hypothetical protein [Fodinibius sp.]NIW49434.1 hypothetical protein [Gammaproteobacteria bacterium]NIY29900.1 hypothetical protein [Fodinibius sp.]